MSDQILNQGLKRWPMCEKERDRKMKNEKMHASDNSFYSKF
jgi:hypothetical protein